MKTNRNDEESRPRRVPLAATGFWTPIRSVGAAATLVFLSLSLSLMGCPNNNLNQDGGNNPDVVVCTDDVDCESGEVCNGGLCVDVGCATKAECAADQVCTEGLCSAPPADCGSTEDCPGVLLCDGFSRQCFDPNATGCRTATDCVLEPGCGQGCTCESDGTCTPIASPEVDGGDPDVPPPDGGPLDGGDVDAGDPIDAGPFDAGEPDPPPNSLDLEGVRIENREDNPPNQTSVFPAGTLLSPGNVLVIGRFATRSEFEAYWGPMPAEVVYLTNDGANTGVPIINRDEIWAIVSAVGTTLDGPTIEGDNNKAFQRLNAGPADDANNWLEVDDDDATPGVCPLPTSGVGLKLCEWSDAGGNGNYVYEFIELYYAP